MGMPRTLCTIIATASQFKPKKQTIVDKTEQTQYNGKQITGNDNSSQVQARHKNSLLCAIKLNKLSSRQTNSIIVFFSQHMTA
jgi:hypothetical protein